MGPVSFYLNEQFNFKKKVETLVCEKYVDLSTDSRHKSVSKTTLFPFLIAYIQLLATIVEAITTVRSHLSEKRDNEETIRASFQFSLSFFGISSSQRPQDGFLNNISFLMAFALGAF